MFSLNLSGFAGIEQTMGGSSWDYTKSYYDKYRRHGGYKEGEKLITCIQQCLTYFIYSI